MSKDQDENQSNTDQWEEGTSDKVETQSQTYTVNWQEISADKLVENYTKLQWEYTKAKQELSKNKKESELSPEDKAAIDFLKNNWFSTKEDIEQSMTSLQRDNKLKDILSTNPDLKPFETAIKQLASDNNIALEDVIEKYGFKSKDKLAKARMQGDIKGTPEKKAKSISDMSIEEYQKYKQEKWWTSNGWAFV